MEVAEEVTVETAVGVTVYEVVVQEVAVEEAGLAGLVAIVAFGASSGQWEASIEAEQNRGGLESSGGSGRRSRGITLWMMRTTCIKGRGKGFRCSVRRERAAVKSTAIRFA